MFFWKNKLSYDTNWVANSTFQMARMDLCKIGLLMMWLKIGLYSELFRILKQINF